LKILIIRFSSIGDIVLTTPVIRCVKQQLPNAEIHFLTKESFSSILQGNPHIYQLHFLRNSIEATVSKLKMIHFDYIIDLHKNQRTFAIKRQLWVRTYSFNKLNIQKWLMVNFKINKLPNMHIVDRYMGAVAKLGVVNDGEGLDYYIPAVQQIQPEQMPEPHRNGYVAIAIGAAHFTKRYALKHLIVLCQLLKQPIVLLGGPEDKDTGQQIVELSGNPNVWNACGLFNLHGSASLVEQARVVVSNDTGLMHIAAAFQKPIVSIWGNTIPEFGMYPYYGKNSVMKAVIVQNSELSCRPCSKIGFEKCPKSHFKCMMDIAPSEVAGHVDRLW
jgi:ADP-heptose:LPS heptosyltransferase